MTYSIAGIQRTLAEYGECCDGIAVRLSYRFADLPKPSAEIVIDCFKGRHPAIAWTRLAIAMAEVDEIGLKLKSNVLNYICLGVRALQFGDQVCIDVDGNYDLAQGPASLAAVRETGDYYLIGTGASICEVPGLPGIDAVSGARSINDTDDSARQICLAHHDFAGASLLSFEYENVLGDMTAKVVLRLADRDGAPSQHAIIVVSKAIDIVITVKDDQLRQLANGIRLHRFGDVRCVQIAGCGDHGDAPMSLEQVKRSSGCFLTGCHVSIHVAAAP